MFANQGRLQAAFENYDPEKTGWLCSIEICIYYEAIILNMFSLLKRQNCLELKTFSITGQRFEISIGYIWQLVSHWSLSNS